MTMVHVLVVALIVVAALLLAVSRLLAQVEQLVDKLARGLAERRALADRIRGQRREIKTLRAKLGYAETSRTVLADDVRVLLATKRRLWALMPEPYDDVENARRDQIVGAVLHDGNHEDCLACVVFREAGEFCTEPWPRTLRARRRVA